MKSAFILSGLFTSLLLLKPQTALASSDCSPANCFSKANANVQERVLSGETVVLAKDVPGTPFQAQFAYKLVRGASPELIAGLFATHEELKVRVDAIRMVELAYRTGGEAVLRYELDVTRLLGPDAGKLASQAPVSRYAVTNRYFAPSPEGAYLVEWALHGDETTKLNPKKGLFGGLVGNLGEPERVRGFFLVEPIPGTPDSVISYGNHVVPKSSMARPMAGTINKTSGIVLGRIVERISAWAEQVSVQPTASQERYRNRICELLITK